MPTIRRPLDVRRDDFDALFVTHRRELHVHCYRMTGSFTDAEDLTQDVFVRAWNHLDTFEGRASARTWLYRIATNICLDFLKSHQRRAVPSHTIAETLEHDARLDPYPDRVDPGDQLADAETTDLYLTAALLHLPPRQRATVVARDLLGFDAMTSAAILDSTATAVNSLLQRAHHHLRRLGSDLDRSTRRADPDVVQIVAAYVDAHQRGDVDTLMALVHDDVRIGMPPEPPCIGAEQARAFFDHLVGADGPGDWRLVPLRANGAPACANYVRPAGSDDFDALSIDVLRISDGRLAGINCFLGMRHFDAFGLPHRVPA